MKTISRTFAIITGLIAGLVAPAAASERHPGDDKNTSEGSARFGATACRLPSDGHVQFMGGGGPFKGAGGSGSYGQIFFGGAGTRVGSHGASNSGGAGHSTAPAHGPVGSGGGSGSGGGAPAAGGGGTPTAGGGGTPAAGGGSGSWSGNPGSSHWGDDHGPGNGNGNNPKLPGNGNHNGWRNHGGGGGAPAAATPEPGSAILFGTGLVGLLARFGRRRRKE